jgi:hypothetical protein
MKKHIITKRGEKASSPGESWLDLERLAEVALTSEDPHFPIEAALVGTDTPGWRAAEPGSQVICLYFSNPQDIKRIELMFVETQVPRTQEFVLRWLGQAADTFVEIVRQQYTFSPAGSTMETEDYSVNLSQLQALEISIAPDIGGNGAFASLTRLRLMGLGMNE